MLIDWQGVHRRVAAITGERARLILYKDAACLWAGLLFAAFASFIFWGIAARLYEDADVGEASAAISGLLFIANLGQLGLGAGIIRFRPDSPTQVDRMINWALTTAALTTAALSLVFVAGTFAWAPALSFLAASPLTFAAFTLFAIAVTAYYVEAQVFLSEGRGELFLLTSLIYGAGELLLIPVLDSLSSWGLIVANGAGFLIAAVVGAVVLARIRPGYRPLPVLALPPSMAFLRFSLVNQATNLLLVLPNLVLPIMAVNFLGKMEGAHFFVAWMIGFFAISISFAFDLAFFVYGSRRDGGGDNFRTVLAIALGVSVVACAVLLVAGDSILDVFGDEYRQDGGGLLRWVALASIPGMIVALYIGRLRVQQANLELILLMSLRTGAIITASAYLMATSESMTEVGVAFFLSQLAAAAYALVRLAGWRSPAPNPAR